VLLIVFLVLVSSTLIAGEVDSIVGDQVVVKSTAQPPAIGSVVYSEKGTKVGVVADIIGPVEKPYFIVKANANVEIPVGERLRSN
jgi:rRNA processing protein Gar1